MPQAPLCASGPSLKPGSRHSLLHKPFGAIWGIRKILVPVLERYLSHLPIDRPRPTTRPIHTADMAA